MPANYKIQSRGLRCRRKQAKARAQLLAFPGKGYKEKYRINKQPSHMTNMHRAMEEFQTHLALVQSMNTVAHTLGKKTVAEFVENENILKILHELKIDCGQGYYLGEPSPIL